MVQAVPKPEDVARRNKLRQALYDRGVEVTSERNRMPLIEEDVAKDEWLHQEVLDDSIMTIAQKYCTDVTSKQMIALCYDLTKYFVRLADGRLSLTEIQRDGGAVTHHQKMHTPWIISDRSIFATTYHQHSDTVDGPYTLVRSSEGNQAISDENNERIGDDVEADLILFWVQVTPVDGSRVRIRFAMQVNLGGSLPGKLRQIISSKQAGLIDAMAKQITNNPQELEDTFKEKEEEIMANIQTQKEERDNAAKAIEEKRLRKEAKKKAKLDSSMHRKAEEEAALAAKTKAGVGANDEEDAEFGDANFGGMSERNPASSRKLVNQQAATAEKVPDIQGLPQAESTGGDHKIKTGLNEMIVEDFTDSDEEIVVEKKQVEQLTEEQMIEQGINAADMPAKVTFEDVKFTVKIQDDSKKSGCSGKGTKDLHILKGCSGSAMPGQATFIMGSSGAGKTSLLNAISDRISNKNGNKCEGQVLINDKIPLNQSNFGDIGAYVMQDDVLFQYFTVEEAFSFAAKLKLNASPAEQRKRVKKLMNDLGLWSIRSTLVGGPNLKTISGGERKRTAIGVEMITDPQLLLLDEPTSGLDSFRAFSIVRFLQKQARRGKTIIATIHQPSSEAFAMFDKVILMCDGHIVYQGPSYEVPSHFAKGDIIFKKFCNPADISMKILSINYPKQQADDDKV